MRTFILYFSLFAFWVGTEWFSHEMGYWSGRIETADRYIGYMQHMDKVICKSK